VALVRIDVSEEHISSIIRVMTMEVICSSEMSVLTRATWRNIPADGILQEKGDDNSKANNRSGS
jgi:hypothetical protein